MSRWQSDSRTATNWIPGFSTDVPEPGAPEWTVQPGHGGQPQPLSYWKGSKYTTKYDISPMDIKTSSRWSNFGVQCVILVFVPGETEQSYSCHSAELYDSDGQRQSSSFWPEYSSPGFAAPQPHPPLASCPSNHSTQSSEQYCPRVGKRKNTHPQRPDREGQMTGMSAYPGQNVLTYLFCASL